MTESRQIPNPPIDPRPARPLTASEHRGRRIRLVAAFGLAVAIATTAVGGYALAGTSVAEKAATVQAAPTGYSHDGDVDDWDDAGQWDDGEWTDGEWNDDADWADEDWADADWADADGADEDGADGYEDPFADYTDEQLDALSDEEFEQLLDDSGWTIDDEGYLVPEGQTGQDDDSRDDDQADFGDDEVLGASAVDGDTLETSSVSPEVARQSQEIWDRFVQLIPADQRQMLTGFELNPAEASGAYVYPNDADPSTWTMGVSLGLDEDLDFVLIHEFGHLLTLQAEEVPPAPDADPDACPTYFTGEGCALSGTTMAEFVQRFWPQSQLDELNRLQDAEDYNGLEAFYEDNQTDFVTDYATTNPAEDLAETFTVFVLNDRPTGDTIADQKVNLLWEDGDMVALREQIRANR